MINHSLRRFLYYYWGHVIPSSRITLDRETTTENNGANYVTARTEQVIVRGVGEHTHTHLQ